MLGHVYSQWKSLDGSVVRFSFMLLLLSSSLFYLVSSPPPHPPIMISRDWKNTEDRSISLAVLNGIDSSASDLITSKRFTH